MMNVQWLFSVRSLVFCLLNVDWVWGSTHYMNPDQVPVDTSSLSFTFKLIHAPSNVSLIDLYDGVVVDPGALGVQTPRFDILVIFENPDLVPCVAFQGGPNLHSGCGLYYDPFYYCGDYRGPKPCSDLYPSPDEKRVAFIPTLYNGTELPELSVTFTVAPGPPTPAPTLNDWNLHGYYDIHGSYSGDAIGTDTVLSKNGRVLATLNGALVYMYRYEWYGWTRIGHIVPPGEAIHFSQSLAMDAHGTTVIFGDPFPQYNTRTHGSGDPIKKGPGYAIVWHFDQATGLYEQKWSIVTNNVTGDELGWSVDMSDDGSVIIVGSRATCIVRILRFVDGDWEDFGPDLIGSCTDNGWMDPFGTTVRLAGNGNVVAIAEPFSTDEGFSMEGFDRNGFYKQGEGKGKVLHGDTPHEAFGLDLALSDDGTVLAISAPFFNNGTVDGTETIRTSRGKQIKEPSHGLCRVLEFSGSSWTQRGSDLIGTKTFHFFGTAIALSTDGNTLAVTALEGRVGELGSVGVYRYVGGEWAQAGKNIPGPFSKSNFGVSVALSADGGIVAVGSPSLSGDQKGSVQVYETGNTFIGNDDFALTMEIVSEEEENYWNSYRRITWTLQRIDEDEGILRSEIDQGDDDLTSQLTTAIKLMSNETTINVNISSGGVYLLTIQHSPFWGAPPFLGSVVVRSPPSGGNHGQILVDEVLQLADDDHATFTITTTTALSNISNAVLPVGTSSNNPADPTVADGLSDDTITLSLEFDEFPEDIHWALVAFDFVNSADDMTTMDEHLPHLTTHNQTRRVVAYGPTALDYPSAWAHQVHNFTIDISGVNSFGYTASQFELMVVDTKWDGLCCETGKGSFSLWFLGSLLVSSSAEGIHRESHIFSLPNEDERIDD